MLASKIRRLPHARNIAINTIGNYVGYAFAAFYIVFLVRFFNPAQFGILTILQAFSYLMANILSFGIPASLYAHIPHHLPDKKKAFDFITSNFIFLTVLSSISLVGVYFLSPYLDAYIFKTGADSQLFLYALIGTQLYIWQNFVRDVLNAAGRFMHINIVTNISNLLKVILLIVAATMGKLSIGSVLIIMGIIGPLFVFLCVLYERRWLLDSLRSSRISRDQLQFNYTFIYFISTQVFSLATRADLFLVSYFLTRPEVGFYGLSQRIILAVVTSSDSITQVMSPQFAKISSQEEVWKLLKHSWTYMLVPTMMFIGGIIMPSAIYELVFSTHYTSSTMLTKALSVSYIPYSFLAALLLFFLYTIKKPRYLLISNIIFLLCIMIGNLILIPKIRILGPSISYLIAFAAMSVYLGHAFLSEMRLLPKK